MTPQATPHYSIDIRETDDNGAIRKIQGTADETTVFLEMGKTLKSLEISNEKTQASYRYTFTGGRDELLVEYIKDPSENIWRDRQWYNDDGALMVRMHNGMRYSCIDVSFQKDATEKLYQLKTPLGWAMVGAPVYYAFNLRQLWNENAVDKIDTARPNFDDIVKKHGLEELVKVVQESRNKVAPV